MGKVLFPEFKGLSTGVANASHLTAATMKNVLRHKKRGELWEGTGYAKKYALPQDNAPAGECYLDPAIYKISNLDFKDEHVIFVAEHGGREVTIAIGTYRKTSRYDAAVYTDRMGIWARPYWSGAAWVDAWLELTECEILKLTTLTATSTLNFADAGFANDHLKDWIVVFEDYTQAQDHDNYLLVTGSTSSSLTYFGDNDAPLVRAADAKMIVVRSFLKSELPSSIVSYIFSILSEIRFTSGNSATDVSLMAGFRTKTWAWGAGPDRLICDVGCWDVWRYAAGLDLPAVTKDSDPIPEGLYSLKYSIRSDTNQISDLRLPNISDTDARLESVATRYYNSRIFTDGASLYVGRGITIAKCDIHFNELATYDIAIPATYTAVGIVDSVLIGTTLFVLVNMFKTVGAAHAYMIVAVDYATLSLIGTPYVHDNDYATAVATDGTFLYAKYGTTVVNVDKFLAATIALDSTYTADTEYLIGDGYYYSPDLVYYNGFLYSTSTDLNSPYGCCLLKINPATMAIVGSALLFGNDTPQTMVLAGEYLFVGVDELYKVDPVAMTAISAAVGAIVALATAETYLYGIIQASISTPAVVKMIDVAAMTEISSTTLAVPLTLYNAVYLAELVYTPREILNFAGKTKIYCDGTTRIDIKALISAGAMSLRMRYLRIYISSDSTYWYGLKDIDLYDTTIAWDATAFYDSVAKHFYRRSAAISIKNADLNAPGAEASTDIGRALADTGVIKYKTACAVGGKTYAVGVLTELPTAQNYPNKLFACATAGDGNTQADVFPNDALHQIDLDYNDGDECLLPVTVTGDKVLVYKNRSIVLVSPYSALDGSTGYNRDVLTKTVGMASIKSLAQVDDFTFWIDYNGVWSYSTRGLELINPTWQEELRALSDAVKEAAVGVIDRKEMQYRLALNGKEYVFDIEEFRKNGEGNWTIYDLADQPEAFAVGTGGVVDFLSGGKIQSLGTGNLHDGASFYMLWESNKFQPLLSQEATMKYDLIVTGVKVLLETTVTVTIGIYLDDATSAAKDWTIASGITDVTLMVPIGTNTRCKSFRFRISGTKAASNDTMRVKTMEGIYEVVAGFGSV
jgi:hypothetical protein